MPYVIGTYMDPLGVTNVPLAGLKEIPMERCRQAINWQVGPGDTGAYCTDMNPNLTSNRTAWHICDPHPEPYAMLCLSCGNDLPVTRGALTWEAYHKWLRGVWDDLIPLTVAELRLAIGNQEGNKP